VERLEISSYLLFTVNLEHLALDMKVSYLNYSGYEVSKENDRDIDKN
jgi:hypothetical protein